MRNLRNSVHKFFTIRSKCSLKQTDCNIQWNVCDILLSEAHNVPFAILVLNQPIYSDPSLIKRLWTKAQFRFAVDGGANRWLQFIQKNCGHNLPLPNQITGDFDSITETSKQYFKEKNVVFVETPDQNATDFTKALAEAESLLKKNNVKVHHILALATNSGRVDQIMANLETLHTAKSFLKGTPVILMSSNSLTWLLPKEQSHSIYVPDDYRDNEHAVGLIPLLGTTKVTTTGLKWDLDNQVLAFGELVSTSNTFKDTKVTIKCEKDLIWTVQYTVNEE